MIRRMYKRLARSKAKWWLMLGGFLGAGMLPCPECGTPMILHVWPLAGMVLVAQAIKKRAQRKEPTDSDVSPLNLETSCKELHEKKEYYNG